MKLKPCPWCGKKPAQGGPAILPYYIVRCTNYLCEVISTALSDKSQEDADRIWNTRAGSD